MNEAEIAAAKESLYATPEPTSEPEPVLSVADGLSARSRRRLKSAS
jgi:hypothetical protein